jgi:hypothetical protein
VCYKVFASLVLHRLKKAGAEDRLTHTQFGFRCKRGTDDAIFAARRYLELAWAKRSGQVNLLALDWKMAFDSIDPAGLIAALRRFGLPSHVLGVIGAIYADRRFSVIDIGNASKEKQQRAGISQACPLSPFFFIMLMTIVMEDTAAELDKKAKAAYDKGDLATVLYADDTLLIGVSPERLQNYLDAVAVVGARFGLELHWDKFQLLQVRCSGHLRAPDGKDIAASDSMTYLGTNLRADGTIKRELGRKLAMAWADFQRLDRLWRHTSVSRARKFLIFQATISSRALYGLSGAWLNASERRRLDGFQSKCLRKILGIPAAYFSRISNKEVLNRAQHVPYTTQLLKKQLMLYGRIGRAPDDDALRSLTFCPGSLTPATSRFVRRVGRPRHEWASQLNAVAVDIAGGIDQLESLIGEAAAWKDTVDNYYKN